MRAPAGIYRLYRRFCASTRGVAGIEFAMILPVLAIMFLGSFDGGRAIAIYMKVRSATYTLSAIVNQYETIQASDMTSITGATAVVLAPYSSSPVVVTITQIAISSKGAATVAWSYSQGGTAHTQGAAITIPSNITTLATPSGSGTFNYVIFAEVSYTFTPMFGYFTSGNINFSDNLYVTPRSSSCIVYVPQQNATACT
jgi:Flp pilus assembly protein TadG